MTTQNEKKKKIERKNIKKVEKTEKENNLFARNNFIQRKNIQKNNKNYAIFFH